MEIGINTFHILQCDLLTQDHLVESPNEECIQEAAVENCKTDNTTNKLEIVKMLGVDTRVRVDLEGIVVMCGIFEETIERVEHLMRKEEEELSARLSVFEQ
jgi:alkyl hydroperoxide reductase subunit AhpF